MFKHYHDLYSPDIVVLGINQEETLELVQDFTGDLNLSYEILLDKNAVVAELYRVFGLPVTVFIDREGVLRFDHIGLMAESQFDKYLLALGVNE